MAQVWQVIGKDGRGVPRVFGEGPSFDVAESRCAMAVREYVARRRDTGPADSWTMESAYLREDD